MSEFPLTNFIIAMMKATTAQLASVDVTKMAAKYQINEKHCRQLIHQELLQRGASNDVRAKFAEP